MRTLDVHECEAVGGGYVWIIIGLLAAGGSSCTISYTQTNADGSKKEFKGSLSIDRLREIEKAKRETPKPGPRKPAPKAIDLMGSGDLSGFDMSQLCIQFDGFDDPLSPTIGGGMH